MSDRKPSTIAALLEDRPKRGRPRRAVSRKNVYVALSQEQKQVMKSLAEELPKGLVRSDIPDMAVSLMASRLELLRQAVSDRNREIPEGITDMDSLYLLWDLPLPGEEDDIKWTSIRLSPQQAIDLGRVHGTLKALFGANRSQVFGLSLALLSQYVQEDLTKKQYKTIADVDTWVTRIYL